MPNKRRIKFAGAHLLKVQFELEATSFDAEDLKACFRLKKEGHCNNTPDFRLITLEGPGRLADGEEVQASVGVSLLCRSCATEVARETLDVIEGLKESDPPTLALMLLPMHIESTHAEMLRVNLTPEVLTDSENQKRIWGILKR
jgi:hypothetical protein